MMYDFTCASLFLTCYLQNFAHAACKCQNYMNYNHQIGILFTTYYGGELFNFQQQQF